MEVVAARRRGPQPHGDRLTGEEAVTMVANLLVGGHEITSSQIGCTRLTLLSQPNAVAALRSEPSLLPALVSKTIHFEPSITGAPRTVFGPIEVCGTLRPIGTIAGDCDAPARDRSKNPRSSRESSREELSLGFPTWPPHIRHQTFAERSSTVPYDRS